nr:hypothetical protein [Tanacetum cinerariifolium]
MDTKKHVLDLEAFREMLHISPRIPGQPFDELPFEEEILEFLRDDVLFTTIKVVSRHQTTQQYGVILPIELTNDDIRNSKAYKEYYACATGEAAPKPKASARKKTGGSASSTAPPTPITTPTPTTTIVAAPRLSAAAKETREQVEESFDSIPRTPEDDEDDDNNEEDQGLRIGEEERMQEEEDAEELYHDVDINQGRGLQVSQETEDTHVILTPIQSDAQQESSSTSSFMTNMLNPITDPGRSTTGSQSRQLFASESVFAKEPVQPTCQMEEPSHPVFETGAKDQPIVQTSHHPEWFS